MGDNRKNKQQNLAYAIDKLTAQYGSKQTLSEIIGIHISTINRWLSGDYVPRNSAFIALANACRIDVSQFDQSHHKFISLLDERQVPMLPEYKHIEQRVELRSIEKWKNLWDEVADKYAGSYFFYNRVSSDGASASNHVARSLLHINYKTRKGIEFEIHNIDTKNRIDPTPPLHYTYRGLMFPIYDVLFFVGEEHSSDEVISIITASSQKSPPLFISGHFTAIRVTPSSRVAAGARVLLQFISRKRIDVEARKSELGVFNESVIPEFILDRI
jgi:hypothetical protein